jgi:hypothetical protein
LNRQDLLRDLEDSTEGQKRKAQHRIVELEEELSKQHADKVDLQMKYYADIIYRVLLRRKIVVRAVSICLEGTICS